MQIACRIRCLKGDLSLIMIEGVFDNIGMRVHRIFLALVPVPPEREGQCRENAWASWHLFLRLCHSLFQNKRNQRRSIWQTVLNQLSGCRPTSFNSIGLPTNRGIICRANLHDFVSPFHIEIQAENYQPQLFTILNTAKRISMSEQ